MNSISKLNFAFTQNVLNFLFMSCITQTLSTLLMMSRILALITMLRLRGPVPTFLARSAEDTWWKLPQEVLIVV